VQESLKKYLQYTVYYTPTDSVKVWQCIHRP